jgi:hypothetical protein
MAGKGSFLFVVIHLRSFRRNTPFDCEAGAGNDLQERWGRRYGEGWEFGVDLEFFGVAGAFTDTNPTSSVQVAFNVRLALFVLT